MNGYLYALAAFGLWGFVPIYWRGLIHYGPLELFAHRLWWSFLVLMLILGPRTLWRDLKFSRDLLTLMLTSALVMSNWYIFVWAVNNDYIVAASLGYFLNPLFNVFLGVTLLGERLRPLQWGAVVLAALGVLVALASAGLTGSTDTLISVGISLGLAGTFALYGLLRKRHPILALRGLFVEVTLAAVPLSLWMLFWGGPLEFQVASLPEKFYVFWAGPLTLLPLFFFNQAVKLLPYSTLGLLQYLAPSLQFFCGVYLYGESFSGSRPLTFALVWLGLALMAWDGIRWRNASRLRARLP